MPQGRAAFSRKFFPVSFRFTEARGARGAAGAIPAVRQPTRRPRRCHPAAAMRHCRREWLPVPRLDARLPDMRRLARVRGAWRSSAERRSPSALGARRPGAGSETSTGYAEKGLLVSRYGVRIEEDKGFIDGLPGDAVKVISFVGLLPRQARELSSVRAHRLDLAFARKCLELINETENDGIRQALRRSAATHYAKCFAQAKSTNERKPLHPNKVLEPGEARKIHRYFTSHRDKHLIHDVNAWLQVPAGAVIAAGQGLQCRGSNL